jgi:hypothetical protein
VVGPGRWGLCNTAAPTGESCEMRRLQRMGAQSGENCMAVLSLCLTDEKIYPPALDGMTVVKSMEKAWNRGCYLGHRLVCQCNSFELSGWLYSSFAHPEIHTMCIRSDCLQTSIDPAISAICLCSLSKKYQYIARFSQGCLSST